MPPRRAVRAASGEGPGGGGHAGLIPDYNARQMTYDLRRLRRKGLIRRIPRSQR